MVIRPTRPDFVTTATEAERETIGRHFAYLKAAFEARKVTYVGRCEDAAFGLVIFEAEDQMSAEAWAMQDPAVAAGVFSLEVRAFRVVLSADVPGRSKNG